MLFIVVIVGPVLAAVGIGATFSGLALFLVIFIAAATPVIARELRPAVSLSSSADRGERLPRDLRFRLLGPAVAWEDVLGSGDALQVGDELLVL